LQKYLAESPVLELPDFQDTLYKDYVEKDEGRIRIVDDKNLSTATIDTKIASTKARYGDKLALVAVDYVNQVVLPGNSDIYDWKTQIEVAKTLKNTARKHDICLVSPYQIDDTGIARFAKGLLDSPDVAQLIKVPDKESGHLVLETTKARSASDTGVYTMGINWECLTIDPRPVILEGLSSNEAQEGTGTAVKGLEL